MTSLEDLIPVLKMQKEAWFRETRQGDMPPYVLAEKDGKVVCVVRPDSVDKHKALNAAYMLHKALAVDSLTIMTDSYTMMGNKDDRDKWKGKSMQAEVAAGRRGDILDCLSCIQRTKDGRLSFLTMPYEVYEQNDPVYWLTERQKIVVHGEDGSQLGGYLADALEKIFAEPSILNTDLDNLAKSMGLDDKARQEYHVARAIFAVLEARGYTVWDELRKNPPPE